MPYENYRMAPLLKWSGDKFNNIGTYDHTAKKGYRFYQMPIDLISYLYSIIPGKHGNVIKLITFLIGSGENLGISEKLVEERTGLSHQAYCAARKWLISNEPTNDFFIHDKENHEILINYDKLWKDQAKYKKTHISNISYDENETHYEQNGYHNKWDWE